MAATLPLAALCSRIRAIFRADRAPCSAWRPLLPSFLPCLVASLAPDLLNNSLHSTTALAFSIFGLNGLLGTTVLAASTSEVLRLQAFGPEPEDVP